MAGIDSDLIRGHIDTIILKSLYHGDKYGLEIIQEIEEKSNGSYELKQPTLYSCLKRLEGQGLISSYWEDSEIGGKRHYYKLTDLGKETYKNNQEEWLRSREIIDNLIYNTTIDYAPIYDNDAEKSASQPEQDSTTPVIDQIDTVDEISKNSSAEEPIEEIDYLADDTQTDEFATFEQVEDTAFNTFFDANNEIADSEEFNSYDTIEQPLVINEEIASEEEPDEEPVSLDLSDVEENSNEDTFVETDEQPANEYLSFIDAYSTKDETEELLFTEETTEVSDDDEIYNPEPEIPEDEQIYVPEEDLDSEVSLLDEVEDAKQEIHEEAEVVPPTYINFDNNNYEEADITNNDFVEENSPEETEFTENYFLEIEPDDDKQEENTELSIEETAQLINEQYNSQVIPRASQEEIDNLYKTTENYENLQAGYTDETYKQMLNELESYGSSTTTSDTKTSKATALSYTELSNQLEAEGITIRKYEKQVKESNDTKIYIKTNKIHLIKNWITFGITVFALLVTFLAMNAFKDSFSYNFKFWPFAVAAGVAILLPLFSTIKFAINPYKKVVAKYAPRLNILISVLITIQLILIIYCVNIQMGFYSFSQENYNHLLWILPLILSFIPIIQSLVYLPLYNSKNYHT